MEVHAMVNTILETLNKSFPFIQKDIPSYANQKVGMMDIHIDQYEIQGVGNLSVLKGEAKQFGMKMDTLVLVPLEKDAPLYSYDRIYAMGMDTCIVEVYDTLLDKENPIFIKHNETMNQIKESFTMDTVMDLGTHWYDSLKLPSSFSHKGENTYSKQYDSMVQMHFDAYIQMLHQVNQCNPVEKKTISRKYVNGLFEYGGPATDEYVKSIGK